MEVTTSHSRLALTRAQTNPQQSSEGPEPQNTRLVPPLILETVRMAAIDHIESYQESFQQSNLFISNGVSEQSDAWEVIQTEPSGSSIRKTIIQTKLIAELTTLCQSIAYVDEAIGSKRMETWASQGMVAIGAQVILSLLPLSTSPLPALAGLAYIPVAAYFVGHYETTIKYTRKARHAFERLLEDAYQGRLLREKDISFVISDRWDKVPWKVLPISVEAWEEQMTD